MLGMICCEAVFLSKLFILIDGCHVYLTKEELQWILWIHWILNSDLGNPSISFYIKDQWWDPMPDYFQNMRCILWHRTSKISFALLAYFNFAHAQSPLPDWALPDNSTDFTDRGLENEDSSWSIIRPPDSGIQLRHVWWAALLWHCWHLSAFDFSSISRRPPFSIWLLLY